MARVSKILLLIVAISSTACALKHDATNGKPHMTTDIPDRVRKIVIKRLGVDRGQVTENANFVTDFGANHLDMIELKMAFEEEFGCEISDHDAKGLLTVRDVVNLIEFHS